MERKEAIAVLKGLSDNPLFSNQHKAAFDIAIHDITDNESEYERGLNEAEMARLRLINAKSDGGLSINEMLNLFDTGDYGFVFGRFTIYEIIKRLRAYDERKQQEELKKACDDEIHVGDEIYCLNSNHKYVVLGFLDNGKIFVFSGRGLTGAFPSNQVHKTGRKYPIMEILEKLNQLNESEE